MSKNAITYAISRIKTNIPKPLLELTFVKPTTHRFAIPVSLESRIREEVIEERVIQDLDIIGGTEITISLRNLECIMLQPGVYVYKIPPDLTQGRQITTALSVAFTDDLRTPNTFMGGGNAIMAAQMQQTRAILPVPYAADARCSVIGNNTIMVQHPDLMSFTQVYLRCIIENDKNLNNLHRTSWLDFADLCVLATKAEIYVKNVIEVDTAYVYGGQEIGMYKTTLDEYADADEMYTTELKGRFARIMLMNDNQMHERFIRLTSNIMN